MRQKVASDIAMILHMYGYIVSVKLFPSETMQNWKAANRYPPPQNIIIYNGRDNICDLANRAKLFILANHDSTAAFEASKIVSLFLLVHLGGEKRSTFWEAVASAHVYSLNDLPEAVGLQLSATQDDHQPNAGEGN